MKALKANSRLRYLGIIMLMLGFVRLPFPSFHWQEIGHQHADGQFCPISGGVADFDPRCEPSHSEETSSAYSGQFSFLSALIGCESTEGEDPGEDGEFSDLMGAESMLARTHTVRASSRDLAINLDSFGLSGDPDDFRSAHRTATRTSAFRNGTSPSYGPSFHTLHQRWAC